ncbi:MAG TPA: nitroreductase family protein [Candidatus Limnocylindrales bacterium]|nr:nitroreductase family protein [Candidatus Limnocylindrales bacterium]
MSRNESTSYQKSYANETMKLLFERASCRSFLDKKIPREVLNAILEAGTHSATAGNLQPYSIIKIENAENKLKLSEMCEQSFIGEAPVLLLFCLDFNRLERWAKLEVAPFTATSSFRHFWVSFQDTIICAQSMCTAADSMGLGSVFIGTVIDNPAEVERMFKLPKDVFPVVLVCLGYPKVRPKPANKLGPDVVVHSEYYCELKDRQLLSAYGKKYKDMKLPLTNERLEEILKVCRVVHGRKFEEKCAEKMKTDGFVNVPQNYFGLHYRANLMPEGNDQYLKVMEESGFNWFKKYNPTTPSAPRT